MQQQPGFAIFRALHSDVPFLLFSLLSSTSEIKCEYTQPENLVEITFRLSRSVWGLRVCISTWSVVALLLLSQDHSWY